MNRDEEHGLTGHGGPRYQSENAWAEVAAHYCTFAVTDVAALMVTVQLLVLAPPLEHPPDQMASRPLLTVSVTDVPVVKLALPVVPTVTLSPAGADEMNSPDRPVAVTVSTAVVAGAGLRPQTLATPAPPHVWGAVQDPQISVPPQPSEIVPQLPVGQVFGMQVCGTQTLFVHVALTAQVPQLSVPPQPSGIVPQFFPCAAHVVGVQPPDT